MVLVPLIFSSVHGAGVKVFKKKEAAKTTENNITGVHGIGFVFSHRPIKHGEQVCVQILQLSHYSNIRFGFTRVNPDSFPKSLLGYSNEAAIKVAECWIQERPHPEFKEKSRICFSFNKGGEINLELNGIDKGTIATEMNTAQGPFWAVIDLCAQDAEVAAIGIKEIVVPIEPQASLVNVRNPPSTVLQPTVEYGQKQKKAPFKRIAAQTKKPTTLNRFDLFEDENRDVSGGDSDGLDNKPKSKQRKLKRQRLSKGKGTASRIKTEETGYSMSVIYAIILITVLLFIVFSTFSK